MFHLKLFKNFKNVKIDFSNMEVHGKKYGGGGRICFIVLQRSEENIQLCTLLHIFLPRLIVMKIMKITFEIFIYLKKIIIHNNISNKKIFSNVDFKIHLQCKI